MRHAPIPEAILRQGLKALSLKTTAEQISQFLIHLEELGKWSRAYSLTSLKTDEDIIVKHFLDSLLYLKAVPEDAKSMMDIGSGAGFPGIPIKVIMPDIQLYLIEPSRKKAHFLKHIVKTINLKNTEVIDKRVEDVEDLAVDVVVTRALFDVRDFVKKGLRLVAPGGVLVVSKGPKAKEEFTKVQDLNYQLLTVPLPLTSIKRLMVVIKPALSDASSGKEDRAVLLPLSSRAQDPIICFNAECRLRKAGCLGFEGCPGFKTRSP